MASDHMPLLTRSEAATGAAPVPGADFWSFRMLCWLLREDGDAAEFYDRHLTGLHVDLAVVRAECCFTALALLLLLLLLLLLGLSHATRVVWCVAPGIVADQRIGERVVPCGLLHYARAQSTCRQRVVSGELFPVCFCQFHATPHMLVRPCEALLLLGAL